MAACEEQQWQLLWESFTVTLNTVEMKALGHLGVSDPLQLPQVNAELIAWFQRGLRPDIRTKFNAILEHMGLMSRKMQEEKPTQLQDEKKPNEHKEQLPESWETFIMSLNAVERKAFERLGVSNPAQLFQVKPDLIEWFQCGLRVEVRTVFDEFLQKSVQGSRHAEGTWEMFVKSLNKIEARAFEKLGVTEPSMLHKVNPELIAWFQGGLRDELRANFDSILHKAMLPKLQGAQATELVACGISPSQETALNPTRSVPSSPSGSTTSKVLDSVKSIDSVRSKENEQEMARGDISRQQIKMIHSFTAEDPTFQISVDAGIPLQVEMDHGDGWIEVSTTKGQRGCVPKAYTSVFDVSVDSIDSDKNMEPPRRKKKGPLVGGMKW